ncbi:MAG: DUF2807 domain-containing protein, partial [Hyphomonadaceae bacterium]|nr:DUF2807 domain-containing protein [Hyphomonadaceae bacterium]
PRDVSNFSAIAASDAVLVEVMTGPSYAVTVTGDDAARITTRMDGDTLRIHMTNRPWFGNPRLDAVVRVTAPRLSSISAARGATVRAENVVADDMALAAAMGAAIRVSGTCAHVDVSAAMGASVNAAQFACASANVSASMGAEVRVNASQTAEASASMGGDISVVGGAQRGRTAASMGGAIRFN